MNQDCSPENPESVRRQARHDDRRVRNQISPPPFSTRDGLISADRRTHLDRRAAWIKNFFIDQGDASQG